MHKHIYYCRYEININIFIKLHDIVQKQYFSLLFFTDSNEFTSLVQVFDVRVANIDHSFETKYYAVWSIMKCADMPQLADMSHLTLFMHIPPSVHPLYEHSSVCLSLCTSVYTYVHLFIHMYVCLYICTPV